MRACLNNLKDDLKTIFLWLFNILGWFWNMGLLGKITLLLVIYSIGISFAVYSNGLYFDAIHNGFLKIEGYLNKINWSLFPIWWLFLSALVYLSWSPFITAWYDMQQKELLRDNNNKPSTVEQVANLCNRMECYRMVWLIIAGLLSLGLNYMDTSNLREIYSECGDKKKDIEILRKYAGFDEQINECRGVKKLGLKDVKKFCSPAKVEIIHRIYSGELDSEYFSNCGRVAQKLDDIELDFTIAYLAFIGPKGNEKRLIQKEANSKLNYAVYIQQFIASWLALFALFQLGLLCYVFWRLEHSGIINKDGLRISLDPFSRIHEFGLEKWNHALNNVYWIFAIGLIIPFVSRQEQPVEGLDTGQMMLQIGVPVLIALPMVATIMARQQRLQDLWSRVENEEDAEKRDLFHQQRLWPLDKNWASKLGIVISFVMLSYLLGANLLKFTG